MSAIAEQAESNAWALARELGLPGVLRRAREAGMSWGEVEGVMISSEGKENPWKWANKCITIWKHRKAEQ